MGKIKTKTHKQVRFLQGEIKRLTSENKRLKKEKNLDKEEIEYDSEGNDSSVELQPCRFCKTGFMSKILIIEIPYWKCSSCEKTCKV